MERSLTQLTSTSGSNVSLDHKPVLLWSKGTVKNDVYALCSFDLTGFSKVSLGIKHGGASVQ